MKAKEVLKILQITRPTLCDYVKKGKVSVRRKPNGTYDYDDESVLRIAGYTQRRKCVIYARVSTKKQSKDLENQVRRLKDYTMSNGYGVDCVYKDVASGLTYDRGNFMNLLNDVMSYNVKTVFVTDKDRLTRVSFDMWKSLFKHFNCELVAVNSLGQDDDNDKEIFSDIISLLHCFAMRMYSSRRKKKLSLIKEDLENEAGL